MTKTRKIVAATASFLMIAALPGPANATGYIRIGDKCYINVAAPGQGGSYPVLVQIACPEEVSEN